MLRARAPRRPPSAVRRALTFWRRSIQARVVASTVILSFIVVSGVGWLLLQQTRDGLLKSRVDEVLAEVADEVDEANDRLAESPATDPDPTAQRRDLVDLIVQRGATRGYEVVVAGPADSDAGRIADGGTESSPGLDLASVPPRLEDHFAGPRELRGVDLHPDRRRRRRGRRRRQRVRHRGRLPADAAGRRSHLHAVLPVPARRGAADDEPGHPGDDHGRRSAAGADRRAHLAGDPPGGHARSGWPAGSPSGWRPAGSPSGCG